MPEEVVKEIVTPIGYDQEWQYTNRYERGSQDKGLEGRIVGEGGSQHHQNITSKEDPALCLLGFFIKPKFHGCGLRKRMDVRRSKSQYFSDEIAQIQNDSRLPRSLPYQDTMDANEMLEDEDDSD
jgi:hypothetical protein